MTTTPTETPAQLAAKGWRTLHATDTEVVMKPPAPVAHIIGLIASAATAGWGINLANAETCTSYAFRQTCTTPDSFVAAGAALLVVGLITFSAVGLNLATRPKTITVPK